MPLLTLLLLVFSGCGGSTPNTQVLYFSGIPDQNISKWSERYEILEQYLTKELDIEVKGIPSKDYASVVIAFEQDQIQFFFYVH